MGIGKASVKNMVLQSLRSVEANSPLIVEFNLWKWSGQKKKVAALSLDDLSDKEQKAVKAFRKPSSDDGKVSRMTTGVMMMKNRAQPKRITYLQHRVTAWS